MRPEALVTAVRRYRVMAYVTGMMLMVLCFVGIPLQVFAHNLVVVEGTSAPCTGCSTSIYLVAAFMMTRLVRHEAGQPADGYRAAGRDDPGADVRGRALGQPPLHRPRPGGRARGRRRPGTRPARLAAGARQPAGEPAVLRRAAGRAAPRRDGARACCPDVHLELETDSGRVLAGPAGSRHQAAARHGAAAARGGPPARPRLRLRPAGAGHGRPVPRRTGLGGRRQPAGAGAVRRNAERAGPAQRPLRRARRSRLPAELRPDLDQPADQDRQGRRCTSCWRAGWAGSRRAAPPIWWCSATWDPTRCSAG